MPTIRAPSSRRGFGIEPNVAAPTSARSGRSFPSGRAAAVTNAPRAAAALATSRDSRAHGPACAPLAAAAHSELHPLRIRVATYATTPYERTDSARASCVRCASVSRRTLQRRATARTLLVRAACARAPTEPHWSPLAPADARHAASRRKAGRNSTGRKSGP